MPGKGLLRGLRGLRKDREAAGLTVLPCLSPSGRQTGRLITLSPVGPVMSGGLGETEVLLLRLGLLILAAKVFGELARRLDQPPVVGEILAGVLIGPSVLGWIPAFGHEGLPTSLHEMDLVSG